MCTYLITGGCGFIGANFVRFLLDTEKNAKVINLDKLTYAANPDNLKGVDDTRYTLIVGDIADDTIVNKIFAENDIDYVVNFAAESHVDNSIQDPLLFFRSNILGVSNLLNVAKEHWKETNNKRFLHISTDEVYGPIMDGMATEQSPLNPSSPYASSKACGDLITLSYFQTYNFPALITRCTNNYGRFQHEEKFIPKIIKQVQNGEDITIHDSGEQTRDWLSVYDHCRAIYMVLKEGKLGEVYNVGANHPYSINEVATMLLDYTKTKMQTSSKIKYVKGRKVDDFRYSLNCEKLKTSLGWEPTISFDQGLKDTIDWYIQQQSK
ncbi:MAG: dTDP-glucose 4,6-dehydratase [Clostridiales bacterium]|nr:dTDP-glucose 4,6-dehydratase [Clostridiales bacterium]